jgi:hypothetical protein
MKHILISITIPIFLVILVIGCKEDTTRTTGDEQIPDFQGRLTSNSECKRFQTASLLADNSDSMSCIEYSYDARSHKLIMKHVNAGFNCCPDSLYCLISLQNDTTDRICLGLELSESI